MGGRGAYWQNIGDRIKKDSKQSGKESDKIIFGSKQLGQKAAKHANEFGLDPKSPTDRTKFLDITKDIVDNNDEVRTGSWRSQPNPSKFYIKGKSVVVINANNEYVTTMANGVDNDKVKRGKRK